MQKTILLTGATDGIGLETAKILAAKGHSLLLHGRNAEKLEKTKTLVSAVNPDAKTKTYIANLSNLDDVAAMAKNIAENHDSLDILINNAGVLKSANPVTDNGFDLRFVVNTIAPYLLTKTLLPLMDKSGRIINLSSAAQSPVDLNALTGKHHNWGNMEAYSQSKLAITMWSKAMAATSDPIIIAVNPGSLLASKMVKEGFGIDGNDISIGADILVRLSLDSEFDDASGAYFDNDKKRIANPHADALDIDKCNEIVATIEAVLAAR